MHSAQIIAAGDLAVNAVAGRAVTRCSGPDEGHYSAATDEVAIEKDVAAIGVGASSDSTGVADSAAHSSADPGLAVLDLVAPDWEGPGWARLGLEVSGSVASAVN